MPDLSLHPQYPDEFAARYRAAGYWTDETFQQFLPRRAEQFPDHVAVIGHDSAGVQRSLTYAELSASAERIAGGFAELGIQAGDRVVLHMPNIIEHTEVLFGLFRLGALPVFALPAHRSSDIAHFINFTDAAAYVIADRHSGFDYREIARTVATGRMVVVAGEAAEFTALTDLRAAAPLAPTPVNPECIAFLQLSGGTTGTPKLIPRTHADYLYSVRESASICGITKDTRMLVVLPASHNFPMSSPGILGVLHAGGTVVLAPDPSPTTTFTLIEQHRVTISSLVPPLALAWLSAAKNTTRDLTSLEVLQVGGAKFTEEAARRIGPELGCTLQQVFGMAEGLVNYTRLDDPTDTIVTTQGRPISPADEIRVVDDNDNDVVLGKKGHLLTRGPYTIRGYFNAAEHNAAAFTHDGFYRTGDIVRVTPDGYIVVEGRSKDQINRGGEKIAPEEVENHLIAHPHVLDAAVVSVPDTYLGERTCAFIVADGTPPNPLVLKSFLRGRGVAGFKVPDLIHIVSEFPATGVGKTSRSELRRTLASTWEKVTSR
ncbi:(2,3-dihydroxybenzoyl)adenylate synthase [Hoyosella rhizosphaerae]|uniref:Long-chain-fatty-acid--CoA ligase n=1 Tax=Hoyosella rhizosphaerae TaxID=1755582 RepID=A0A916X8Y4_9ACTN|nr:AMP-binding protein [Hoyosella rhizosphaerae]GGC53181.1 2,3-dihydroxybenzoate-AMP ligase [Hoyosella rhizosphaerae]